MKPRSSWTILSTRVCDNPWVRVIRPKRISRPSVTVRRTGGWPSIATTSGPAGAATAGADAHSNEARSRVRRKGTGAVGGDLTRVGGDLTRRVGTDFTGCQVKHPFDSLQVNRLYPGIIPRRIGMTEC